MDIIDGIESLDGALSGSTVAIGTFDGVHLGHRAIIAGAVADARANGRPAVVFTFDRHPAELLHPEHAPGRLASSRYRNELISEIGADLLVVARFERPLAAMDPESFLREILKGRLKALSIVEGRDFCFGRNRAGDLDFLLARQSEQGFAVHAVAPVLMEGERVSSTQIRDYLRQGDIARAERALGHPFLLEGVVVDGERLGRTLGYPTANLAPIEGLTVPSNGIYAVDAILADGRIFGGACSIGVRPTVGGVDRTIETYLLDFQEDLYGAPLTIRFLERLRGEERFSSLQALTEQMARDVLRTRAVRAERSG